MGEANNKQYGGTHYQKQAIQAWDFIIQNKLGYLEGTAIKYISRWRNKGGVEDLRKAIHFLEKLIETETSHETISNAIAGGCEQRWLNGAGLSSVQLAGVGQTNFRSTNVANKSSSEARDAYVNAKLAPLDTNDYAAHHQLFTVEGSEYALGRLRHLCDVDEQARDSFPLCTGELNTETIVRPDTP